MAEQRPVEQAIPIQLKSGDIIYEGKNGQLIRFSFSDFTDRGFIDISVGRKNEKKNIQDAKARLYIGTEDNADNLFGTSGKGATKPSQKSVIAIEADEIRLISKQNKNIEHYVRGETLVQILTELIDSLIQHSHPMESPSISFKTKWENIKKKLNTILSKNISGS